MTDDRPAKPYDAYPLYPHRNGSWCKRIRGRNFYFGSWRTVSWQDALDEYQKVADYLHTGRNPPAESNSINVRDALDVFLDRQEARVKQRDITERSYRDHVKNAAFICRVFGAATSVDALTPDHFRALRAGYKKRFGVERLTAEIARTRAWLNFIQREDEGIVSRPIRVGEDFKQPTMAERRRARRQRGDVSFTRDEIRNMLDAADGQLKAVVLVGVNLGYGPNDIVKLDPKIHVNGDFVTFPRPKTGVDRRGFMWPETKECLPANGFKEFPSRERLGVVFRGLMKKADCHRPRRGHYSLRRTLATVAAEVGDNEALQAIMGHEDRSMTSQYVQYFPDERIRRVTGHVHNWLYGVSPTG